MSEGLNRTTLLGSLGADPELRMTASGLAILNLRIATTERIKKKDQWEEHTEWHRVTIFGARADALGKILSKGAKVYIEGSLRTTSYEKDGVKRYTTSINADKILLCGGKRGSGGRDVDEPVTDNYGKASGGGSDAHSEPEYGGAGGGPGGDDIPFVRVASFYGETWNQF